MQVLNQIGKATLIDRTGSFTTQNCPQRSSMALKTDYLSNSLVDIEFLILLRLTLFYEKAVFKILMK